MFAKLHLLSQDVPEGGDGFRWRAHPYLRMAGSVPKGPAVFDWSPRQRGDLDALWQDPTADGARERLGKDLAVFCDKLGWAPDGEQLGDAEKHGDEYMLTVSAVPSELYMLPWEVIQVGAAGTYLSDYASAQVRYAMPGLGPRELETPPAAPGVLFAWSAAGGAVPHDDQAAAIRAAAEAGGVAFRELAEVNEASLQAALEDGAPSVLHLLCHGLPGAEGEPSRLRWGPSDRPSEITGPRLARMLRTHDGIRLVVLGTCGGGDGHGDAMLLGSLAQELHRKGIPSVVASRYPLSVAGSRVMTRALYDKLLREAWSLERALRHTRQALFRVDEDGDAHPGDAYGLQLYAYDTEWFVSDNEVEAERPVLASYPFGTAARPVPASGPPSADLTLTLEEDPRLPGDELVDRLRRLAEDAGLVVVIRSAAGGAMSVVVHTTVDGAQRLLGAWRSRALRMAVGVAVGVAVLTKGISAALGGTLTASLGEAAAHLGAAGQSGAAAHAGLAASQSGAAAAQGGLAASQSGAAAAAQAGLAASQSGAAAAAQAGLAASQSGAAAAQAGLTASQSGAAAAGQAGTLATQTGVAAAQAGIAAPAAASAGKVATVLAFAGKAVTAKFALAALVSSAAVAGGAALYRAETRSAPETMSMRDGIGPRSSSPAGQAKLIDGQRWQSADPAGGGAIAGAASADGASNAGAHVNGRDLGTGGAAAATADGTTANHGASRSQGDPEPAGPTNPTDTVNHGDAVSGGRDGDSPAASTAGIEVGGASGASKGGATGTGVPGGTGPTAANGASNGGPTGAGVPGGTGPTPANGSSTGGATGPAAANGATSNGGPTGPMAANGASNGGTTGAGVPGGTGPMAANGANNGGASAMIGTGGSNGASGTGGSPTRGGAVGTGTADAGSHAVCGNRIQEAEEQCDDGNTRDGDGCSSECLKEIAVDPEVLMAHLKAGDRDVDPSEQTKASLQRHPEEGLSGTVAVCVNTSGAVTKSTIRDGSGYEEYDNRLAARVRTWRYRPYLNSGKVAPVCSTVVFVYHPPRQ